MVSCRSIEDRDVVMVDSFCYLVGRSEEHSTVFERAACAAHLSFILVVVEILRHSPLCFIAVSSSLFDWASLFSITVNSRFISFVV